MRYYRENRGFYGGVYIGEPTTRLASRASYYTALDESHLYGPTSNLNRLLREQSGFGNHSYSSDLMRTTRNELAGVLNLTHDELERAATNILRKSTHSNN